MVKNKMSDKQMKYIDDLNAQLGYAALNDHDRETMSSEDAGSLITWLLKKRGERVERAVEPADERQQAAEPAKNEPQPAPLTARELTWDDIRLERVPATWVVKLRDMLTAEDRQVMPAIAELNRVLEAAMASAMRKVGQ